MEKLAKLKADFHDSQEKAVDAGRKVREAALKVSNLLDIQGLRFGTKQEYDDHNYYNQVFLESIFDESHLELEYYTIEEVLPEVMEFFKSLKASNSVKFITDSDRLLNFESKKEEIQDFKDNLDYGVDTVDVVLACLKKGKSIEETEEIMNFICEILNLREDLIPGEWR